MNQPAAFVPTPSGPIEVTAPASTPMLMLAQAVERGASIEILEKLMALSERWEANQSRKAFDAAISSAKGKIPVISKTREGHNKKKYADFAALARVVDPILGEYGLSYRFRTSQDDKTIKVTCVLSHEGGHSEETTLAGPADISGNKNAIQAIGSTLTYLQRYSLVQALGLAASDDDDGKAAGSGETITDEQVKELSDLLIQTKGDINLFLKAIKLEALSEIRADKFEAAKALINSAADKRKAKP